ncbi:hypothetical protein [Arthrobacter sp. FB24]|uniref:hypothetical protein n=1 Tax=Arthrobacter sp. (strain FB24) TaxID=290399 RepID=UPI0005B99EE0|nr:hypothetical protein [Arthrobacter sp. FB24]
MDDETAASGQPVPPDDRAPLSPRQRVLLYFNTTRRKFWAGATLVAVWLLLEFLLDGRPYLGPVPNLFLYAGIAVLWILFTHGAGLAKPPPMPAEIMRQDAPGRFPIRRNGTRRCRRTRRSKPCRTPSSSPECAPR